jgi:hypothetical protein
MGEVIHPVLSLGKFDLVDFSMPKLSPHWYQIRPSIMPSVLNIKLAQPRNEQ